MKKYMLGIGNHAGGDDAVGLRVVERVIEEQLERDFAAVSLGNDGLRSLNYFSEETAGLLFVDCALIGMAPGEFRLFAPEDVTTRKITTGISTHDGDLLKILDMAHRLELPEPDMRILAIQPASLETGKELSDTLESRLEEYVQAAVEELASV